MSKKLNNYYQKCLFFGVNSLARSINEMTEKAFATTGISATYGHLILILFEQPGLSQNELSVIINVKASTMTRFIDKLAIRGIVERKHEGRTTNVFLTEEGKKMKPVVLDAFKRLYEDYCEVLGEDFANRLTSDIYSSNLKMTR